MTHDELMQMLLLDGADHHVIQAISTAVKERDELRAAVAWDDRRLGLLHLSAANDEADKAQLRKERDAAREEGIKWQSTAEFMILAAKRFAAKSDLVTAEKTIAIYNAMEDIKKITAERDAARKILQTISAEATRTPTVGGYEYAIDAGLMGQIDTALGVK